MKVVGIVSVCAGGSQSFFSQFMARCLSHYQSRSPEIILHQAPFTEYQEAIDSKNLADFERPLLKSLKKIKQWGADFAVIPNNTVQAAVESIKAKSPIHILNLVELVACECVEQKADKVLILGTLQLIQSSVYQRELQKQNVNWGVLDLQSIELMTHEILAAMRLGGDTFSLSIELDAIVRDAACNYDVVLLACSELVGAYHGRLDTLTIDPISLLAEQAIQKAMAS